MGYEEDDQWQQQEDVLARERQAVEALQRCAEAGANPEDLKTLAIQCGVQWKPRQTTGEQHAARR